MEDHLFSKSREKSNKLAHETIDSLMQTAQDEGFLMPDVLITLETINATILTVLAKQYAPTNPKMFVNSMMASMLKGVLERSHTHLDSLGVDPEAEGIELPDDSPNSQ